MPSTTPIGYCEHCKQNVSLRRQEIDTWLAIILLLFTGGIGFIIYLIIYYSKPKNRCVHCGTVVSSILDQQTPTPKQITYQQHEKKEVLPVEIVEGEQVKYCPLCGADLDEKTQNFCPNCGSKI
ncbi:MAG: hypothetical protein ACFFDK_12680 [Promethearchaeota archaeon]